tara:strand:- start:131 stop:694 length:564 start_codon:yes stop_codon:yes gene_type:complete
MKLILENWREFMTEQQGCPDDVVWHGSEANFNTAVRANKAADLSGLESQNQTGVYAFKDKKAAVLAGLVGRAPNGDWPKVFVRPEKGMKIIVINGQVRHGEQVYLYKMPADLFKPAEGTGEKTGEGVEYVSIEPKDVMWCGKETENVNDWLSLVDYATKEDIEWYKRQGQPVTEEDLEFLRSKGSDV